jgi:hypothetical protein
MSVSLESTRIEPVIQKIIFLNIPEIPLRSKGLEPLWEWLKVIRFTIKLRSP